MSTGFTINGVAFVLEPCVQWFSLTARTKSKGPFVSSMYDILLVEFLACIAKDMLQILLVFGVYRKTL